MYLGMVVLDRVTREEVDSRGNAPCSAVSVEFPFLAQPAGILVKGRKEVVLE